ncbi:MAG: hypothetical protein ABL308_07490 [Oceanicaulis sp.]
MKRIAEFAAALALSLAALVLGSVPASAQAIGPEERAYAVDSNEGRYTAQFRRGGRYEDSRGARGSWNFDGRTLCMIVQPPRGGEYEVCLPWQNLGVGESFTTRSWTPDGSAARITRIE